MTMKAGLADVGMKRSGSQLRRQNMAKHWSLAVRAAAAAIDYDVRMDGRLKSRSGCRR